VDRWSQAPIPWPLGRASRHEKRPSYIICADLLRALQRESNQAIQHWWGVSKTTVALWRVALGIPKYNEGTLRLHREHFPELLSEEVCAEARRLGNLPENRAKSGQTQRVGPSTLVRQWTPEEEALLGSMPDPELAGHLKRPVMRVGTRRRQLGIPAFDPRGWSQQRHARLIPISRAKLRARRFALGLTQEQVSQRSGLTSYEDLEAGRRWRVQPVTLDHLTQALQCQAVDLIATDPPDQRGAHGTWGEADALAEVTIEEAILCLRPQDRYALHHGPYHAPSVMVGDTLYCEVRGLVEVHSWSAAPLSWPCCRVRGQIVLIVCGDLVRALQGESRYAIRYWWGITSRPIALWCKVLKQKGLLGPTCHDGGVRRDD